MTERYAHEISMLKRKSEDCQNYKELYTITNKNLDETKKELNNHYQSTTQLRAADIEKELLQNENQDL